MNKLNFGFWLIIAQLAAMGSSALAQITPDTTLPNNSAVTRNGEKITIDEGTVNGSNLFHSFSEFNVNTGETAIFSNGVTIDNIITRVTGGQFSNIDGLIGANGTANLFLLNPNGIKFGANAELNIGGSFVGSTAESFLFEDGSIYSATNPTAPPLLTVNVPLGLQYGSNPNPVQVQEANLQVQSGQTLTLAGGDLDIVGGKLQAPSGRISLGSATAGILNLDESLGIAGLSDPTKVGNINLRQQSSVEVTGVSDGIDLTTGNLTLSEGSSLQTITVVPGKGGDITINATDKITIESTNKGSYSYILTTSSVDDEAIGGNITINQSHNPQGNLTLSDLGFLGTVTYSNSNSGDVQINVDNLNLLNGAQILTESGGLGDAGTIKITADGEVVLAERGLIISYPAKDGTGNLGDIKITASSIKVSNSQLVTQSNAQGNAGNINLVASDSILLDEDSILTSATKAEGNAGKVMIKTKALTVIGSQIQASSSGNKGNAGLINVDAEVVELRGLLSDRSKAGLFVSVIDKAEGEGGNIILKSDQLIIRDGAIISASNFQSADLKDPGQGPVGNIEIDANSVLLSNDGLITTAATNGDRGNIEINAANLQLEDKSNITASATKTATGGNITLNTNTLVAAEDSNISANAEQSFGGRVIIDSQGIFGTQFREQLTPESDITASSDLGAEFSGTVTINNLDADPTSALVELPAQVTDPSDKVIAGCAAASGNSFTITGKGGLPENPNNTTIYGQTTLSDLRDFTASDSKEDLPPVKKQARQQPPRSIVQVNGWIVNQDGEVELVAALPQETSLLKHPNCQDLGSE